MATHQSPDAVHDRQNAELEARVAALEEQVAWLTPHVQPLLKASRREELWQGKQAIVSVTYGEVPKVAELK